MYVGARETLRGWRKNTSAGLNGSVVLATLLAGAGAAPAVAIARGPRLAGALRLALRPTPRKAWPLCPAGALALSFISLISSAGRLRGGVVCRGRRYPTSEAAPRRD